MSAGIFSVPVSSHVVHKDSSFYFDMSKNLNSCQDRPPCIAPYRRLHSIHRRAPGHHDCKTAVTVCGAANWCQV